MNGDAGNQRFRLRVRYVKQGRLAYLGHLELMHSVERIIRRAGLPYAVTQGFSPRMKAAFTTALPVGTASTCEYYDVFLTDLVPAPEALARLRAAAPADLMPDAAAYVDLRAPALTAQITRVGYRVELFSAAGDGGAGGPSAGGAEGAGLCAAAVERALARVRAAGPIAFQRGAKRKTLDLERFLMGARVADGCDGAGAPCVLLDLDTRTTNDGSLRPEVLLAAIDRALRGTTPEEEPIESTGVQRYGSFARVTICRSFQAVELEDGALADPLPAPADGPAPPVCARSEGPCVSEGRGPNRGSTAIGSGPIPDPAKGGHGGGGAALGMV